MIFTIPGPWLWYLTAQTCDILLAGTLGISLSRRKETHSWYFISLPHLVHVVWNKGGMEKSRALTTADTNTKHICTGVTETGEQACHSSILPGSVSILVTKFCSRTLLLTKPSPVYSIYSYHKYSIIVSVHFIFSYQNKEIQRLLF